MIGFEEEIYFFDGVSIILIYCILKFLIIMVYIIRL